jgi:hypothetical protein
MINVAAALRRTTISVRIRARSLACPFPSCRVARKKWKDTSTQKASQTVPPRAS